MPTSRARITFVLNDDDAAELRDLARMNGSTVSALVNDLVGTAMPTIRQLNATLRAAEGIEADLLRKLAHGYQLAGEEIAPEVARLNAEFQGRLKGTEEALRAVGPTVVAVPDSDDTPQEDPRPVTRGSVDPTPHSGRAFRRASRGRR